MTTIIVSVALLFLVRETQHHFERRDLYNRIMAKDLPEYQAKREPLTPRKNFVMEGIKKGERELFGPDE